jgi:hypothetical protein
VVAPVLQPALSIIDQQGDTVQSFQHHFDFGIDIRGHGGPGAVKARVTALAFSLAVPSAEVFEGLDLRGRVAMYSEDEAPPGFAVEALIRGAAGILLIDEDVTPRLQLADPAGEYLRPVVLPVFRIRPSVADALLAPDGWSIQTMEEARTQARSQSKYWMTLELSHAVLMAADLSPVSEVSSENVIGVFRGADAVLNDELVVVATHYDAPVAQPAAYTVQGLDDGASGVAVMLEVVRLWKATGFQPRRTVYFVAWSGGHWEHSGAHEYLAAQSPYTILETIAVVNLGPLGDGANTLLVHGDRRLSELFVRTARDTGLPVDDGSPAIHSYQTAFSEPYVVVGWAPGEPSHVTDGLEAIDVDKLQAAGQAVNLALITLGREYDF